MPQRIGSGSVHSFISIRKAIWHQRVISYEWVCFWPKDVLLFFFFFFLRAENLIWKKPCNALGLLFTGFSFHFLFIHLINTVDLCYSQICVCEFAYLLKFICNPPIFTCSAFRVIFGHGQSTENLSHPVCVFPPEITKSYALPSCFSSDCEQMSFWGSI